MSCEYEIGDYLFDGTYEHIVKVCKVINKIHIDELVIYDLEIYSIADNCDKYLFSKNLPTRRTYPADSMQGYIKLESEKEVLIELL